MPQVNFSFFFYFFYFFIANWHSPAHFFFSNNSAKKLNKAATGGEIMSFAEVRAEQNLVDSIKIMLVGPDCMECQRVSIN